MGLGYVYMDLPYGNKKERIEPESALCWKSEQARQRLSLYKADKVTLAIKSLHFYQNSNVRQSEELGWVGKSDGDVLKCSFVSRAQAPTAALFTLAAAASGIFQLRVNLQA